VIADGRQVTEEVADVRGAKGGLLGHEGFHVLAGDRLQRAIAKGREQMIGQDVLYDPSGGRLHGACGIGLQILGRVVAKQHGLRFVLQESHVPEGQLGFELFLDLYGDALVTADTPGLALPLMVDEHVPLAVFLADLHTHAVCPLLSKV
jgi:hypothetical protein